MVQLQGCGGVLKLESVTQVQTFSALQASKIIAAADGIVFVFLPFPGPKKKVNPCCLFSDQLPWDGHVSLTP